MTDAELDALENNLETLGHRPDCALANVLGVGT